MVQILSLIFMLSIIFQENSPPPAPLPPYLVSGTTFPNYIVPNLTLLYKSGVRPFLSGGLSKTAFFEVQLFD